MIHKGSPPDLAIFGGKPAFVDPLHVGRPNVGDRERFLARVNDLFDRRWFTNNGPFVREFEAKLADILEVKHCVAMCNATTALEIATRALGLHGEVIVPSFTFIATAHALQWQEITPVFCDVAPNTHHIDPHMAEALITPRTTGIIGVHVWGQACDTDSLATVAERHNLRLVYDAAHAFMCSHNKQMIGGFGDVEVFSFHATKFLNTFEGGAATTNDDSLAQKMRFMRNFGFSGYDCVDHIGINGKMQEISAAMGLTMLECMDEIVDVNRDNYHDYQRFLCNVDGLRMVTYDETNKQNYQYVIVEVDSEASGLTRDQLARILHAENVLARRYFYPGCHRMEPYRSYFPHAGLLLPNTERLTESVMSLPTGTAVSTDDVACVCEIIDFAVSHSEEISQSLANEGL